MSDDSVERAISAGHRRASALLDSGMILGAVIFVQGRYICLPAGLELQPATPLPAGPDETKSIHSAQ